MQPVCRLKISVRRLCVFCNRCLPLRFENLLKNRQFASLRRNEMKKLSFEFIKKADFLLVFLLSILGIVFLIGLALNEFMAYRRSRKTPQITVVEDDDAGKIKEYVEFSAKNDDFYIFAVKSSAIKAEDIYIPESKSFSGLGFSNAVGKSGDSDGITNFIFVKSDGQDELKLFPSNVFIYKYEFSRDSEELYAYSHECNIYAVIKGDTNNDKVLSSEDDISLYVSDYNGKNLKEISPSIMSVLLIDKNELLFTEYAEEKLSYFVYDCAKHTKTLLKTAVQEMNHKEIRLY